jgi:predicted AlkP superfamily pyrophosphatase or phosphodiesterase
MKDGFVELYVCLQIVGTLLFIYGFFPQRITIEKGDPKNVETEKFDQNRIVFMIIDAFSFDFFAHAHYQNDMPLLHRAIESGEASLFRARVQSPTVTLPRIKVSFSAICAFIF